MRVHILASGSRGNAVYFEFENARLLIDAGISARRIETGLASIGVKAGELDAILVTHEHSDHINGIEVLARRHHLPVFARTRVWNCLKFRQNLAVDCCREISDGFTIGDVEIEPFKIPHDAVDPVGFALHHRNGKYVLATDLGHATPEVRRALCGADVAVLEANHDIEMLDNGPYPMFLKRRIRGPVGHLSNNDTAQLLACLDRRPTMHVFLAHLSQQNNHPAVAEGTVRDYLAEQGCEVGREIVLHPTFQNQGCGYSC